MAKNSPQTASSALSRRSFLAGATGAVIAFSLDGSPFAPLSPAAAAANPQVTNWVMVNADNTVTIRFGGAELGQGTMTGAAQWLAEELKVNWSQVKIVFTDPAVPTTVGDVNTLASYSIGGSRGLKKSYATMRKAGACARQTLVNGAATIWGVDPALCTVAGGVVSGPSGQSLTYAQVVAQASSLPLAAAWSLTPPSQFTIVGSAAKRIDIPDKSNGKAKFGLDQRPAGLVHAVVKHCPTIGGTFTTVPATPAGMLAVVPLKNVLYGYVKPDKYTAVAVVTSPTGNANHTWAAWKAVNALSVSWTLPTSTELSAMTSANILSNAQSLMTSGTGAVMVESAGTGAGPTVAGAQVNSTFQLPFLAHVCMEVLNCTVQVTGTAGAYTVEAWVPTQNPAAAIATITNVMKWVYGQTPVAVNVHPTLLGGGLGRKIDQDYVAQALQVAMDPKVIGRPVKLMWPREEDLAHDQYRPAALVRVQMAVDATNKVVTNFAGRVVGPSPSMQRNNIATKDGILTEGLASHAYSMPVKYVDNILQRSLLTSGTAPQTGLVSTTQLAITVGYWRSVGPSITCFAVESAMDQAAAVAGANPVAFRKGMLPVRAQALLDSVVAQLGWSATDPIPAGSGRGVAVSNGFASLIAVGVEVVKDATLGTLVVKRVAVAIDCGIVTNPDQVVSQMQGGVIHGISSALWGQTTFSSGKASSRNFSNTRVMRMKETPKILVAWVDHRGEYTTADPAALSPVSGLTLDAVTGGVGEAAVPPMAPALANAWFNLTGTRQTSLPFYPGAAMSG